MEQSSKYWKNKSHNLYSNKIFEKHQQPMKLFCLKTSQLI
jgi:hypothetical protein